MVFEKVFSTLVASPVFIPTALACAIYCAYANVYSFEFLYDDEFLIQKNLFLSSFTSLPKVFRSCSTAGAGYIDSFYRPLQITAYVFINNIFGPTPEAFHVLNVTLHAFNTVLVYALGLRLGVRKRFAFLAALIWGLHPLHTEAVTYMSATADPLHVFFILLGLQLFPDTVTKEKRIWRYSLALLMFVFALMSKEAAIVFPALLICQIFFQSGERRWRIPTYFVSVPAWLVAGLYMVLRKTILNFNGDFAMYKVENALTESVLTRIYTYAASLPNYLELIVWPHDQHMDRAFPAFQSPWIPDVVLGLLLFVIAMLALVRCYLKRRANFEAGVWPAWVALWFFASQVPQAGILIPVNSLFLEHWMYLPTIGIALGIGHGLQNLAENSRARSVILSFAAGGLALFFGYSTIKQNWIWRDPISFYTNILQYNPETVRVRHNLAMAYSNVGRSVEALEEYQIILRKENRYPQTFHNVGKIFVDQGKFGDAEKFFKHAIELDDKFAPSYDELVFLYEKEGRAKDAAEYREKLMKVLAKIGQTSTH